MFRRRQQRRLWAIRMLFVWLFGIGAGFANACLSTAPVAQVGVHAAHVAEVEATGHGGHADPLGSQVSSNCQDFCDQAHLSIPRLKAVLGDVQTPGLTPQVVATVLPTPVFEPVQWRVPRRDGVRAPRIPISFLRLAL